MFQVGDVVTISGYFSKRDALSADDAAGVITKVVQWEEHGDTTYIIKPLPDAMRSSCFERRAPAVRFEDHYPHWWLEEVLISCGNGLDVILGLL